jgi:diaminohydroxyphosphoribosylaminopyrimidine deaminase/5-amino-6-(5-phosphoribosylamino)uracil reductase
MGFRNPVRLIIDKTARLPLTHHLFDGFVQTIVFTQVDKEVSAGVEYCQVDFESGNVLNQIMDELYRRSLQSVIIEGGSRLLNSFLEEGLWDEALVFRSPVLFGKGIAAPQMKGSLKQRTFLENDELLWL